MDTVGKLIAAALLCSVICLLLKKQAPELTLCLCVLVCALCFLTSFPFFSPILAFFHRLQELTGLSGAVFAPLFSGLPQAVSAAASMPATRSIHICFFFIGVPPSLGKALPQDFLAGDECRTIAALPVPILRSLA